jgi:hypothetical protein
MDDERSIIDHAKIDYGTIWLVRPPRSPRDRPERLLNVVRDEGLAVVPPDRSEFVTVAKPISRPFRERRGNRRYELSAPPDEPVPIKPRELVHSSFGIAVGIYVRSQRHRVEAQRANTAGGTLDCSCGKGTRDELYAAHDAELGTTS